MIESCIVNALICAGRVGSGVNGSMVHTRPAHGGSLVIRKSTISKTLLAVSKLNVAKKKWYH